MTKEKSQTDTGEGEREKKAERIRETFILQYGK